MLTPLKVRVPVPVFDRAPDPSMIPLIVRIWPAVSIWKAPVPLAAIVNFFVLAAVLPVYCNVPVLLPEPKITLSVLLPRGPLTPLSLTVAVAKVPAATVS